MLSPENTQPVETIDQPSPALSSISSAQYSSTTTLTQGTISTLLRAPQLRNDVNSEAPLPSPSLSSPRQPQLTEGYVPPPNFSSNDAWHNSASTHRNPQSQIHRYSDDRLQEHFQIQLQDHPSHQRQEYPQVLEDADYEIKGDDGYTSASSQPHAPNRIPYPVLQESPSWVPMTSIGNNQYQQHQSYTQPRNRQENQEQSSYNNVTFVTAEPINVRSTGSRRKWITVLSSCVIVIAVAVVIGVLVSRNINNKGSQDISQNSDNTGSNTARSTTSIGISTTAKPTSTTTAGPTQSSSSTSSTSFTGSLSPSPTSSGGNRVQPPPMPSFPPNCTTSFCWDYDAKCQSACQADSDYVSCSGPCDGEFFCIAHCQSGNQCFQGCMSNRSICFPQCNRL